MKVLKIFLGIILFIIILLVIVLGLAFSTPKKLVQYDTDIDLKAQVLTLASSSSGSRITVSEELLNEVVSTLLTEEIGNINLDKSPFLFGGMNIHLDNSILSVYALLNSNPKSSVPLWIKHIMISGQFEISSNGDIITVRLKKVSIGRLPLPVKTIVKNIDFNEISNKIDISDLSYTISTDALSKLISEDITISNFEIGKKELTFFIGLNSDKIDQMIEALSPLLNKREEIFSQVKEEMPSKYLGIVEDGEHLADILGESEEKQLADIEFAYISWFDGDVTIQSLDEGEMVLADFGMELGRGAVIKTGPNSNVEIVLPDRSLLILQSDTFVVLEQVYFSGKNKTAKASISIEFGRVRSVVKKMVSNDSFYEIKTPSGTAGVRGTDFGVTFSSNNMSSEIVVLSGTINLKNEAGSELIMEHDTIASIDKKGTLSGIKSLNVKQRTEFIQQMPVNTIISDEDSRFTLLVPLALKIMREWDRMTYDEQQEFINIVESTIDLGPFIESFNF